MLLVGDLGFLARVVVAALVVVFAPVLGFVVRRKWRRSLARKEEIKRLLVLASEEIERAEFEAESGYGYDGYNGSVEEVVATDRIAEAKEERHEQIVVPPVVEVPVPSPETVQLSRRLQYQCEVCGSPTKTRCARCKAVRYCSGKCQIIHWRQGHKDECHPFTASDQNNEVAATSPLKPSKGEEIEINNNVAQIGGRHLSESLETYTRESTHPDSNLPKSFDREDNADREPLTEEKGSHSNSKFIAPVLVNELPKVSPKNGTLVDASPKAQINDSSNRHLSTPSTSKTVAGHHNVDLKRPLSETSNAVTSGVNFASSATANLMKPNSVDGDGLCVSSTSSSSSVDGCNESSSEPSTPSSGFWDGTINTARSRHDSLDDNADSCSDDDIDDLGTRFTSSRTSNLGRNFLSERDVTGNSDKIVFSDGPHRIYLIKKQTNGPSSQIKVNKEGLDIQFSSRPSLETPQETASSSDSEKVTKCVESAASLEVKTSSLSPSNPEKPNSKTASQRSIPQETKASDEMLPGNHGRYSVQNVRSFSDKAHGLPLSSTDYRDTPNGVNNSKPSVWKVVDQLRVSKLAQLSTLGAVSENVTKYNGKGLFPYDLFVKLYTWNKVDLLPCGLVNCGNSCYANAVLQCLSFTPPLTAYFLQGLHSKACKKTDWCFTCEFENLVLKAKDGKSPISPSRIISHLQNIGSHLGNGREEDAHEFLRYAIDTMQAVCLKAAGVSASSSLEETTLLGLTFGGYLRSKIECMRCGGKSERHERMMDLTVEIEGDIGTLEEALRQFTHSETLDGENKYHCSRCKSYEKAKKKLRVLEAPNILTIALKRFQSGKFGKLNKVIKFPEILDLAPYMSGTSDKSPIYRLYGVIVHLDIMNASFSGHYVCYVKNTQNKWFKIDDSTVKAVELSSVLTKGAYMLLYARCSPRGPRLIRRSSCDSTRKSNHPDSKPRHYPRSYWDPSHDNNQMRDENFPLNYSSFEPFQTIWEEDSSSDKSSSLFSEVNSCSTDSSNRDSLCPDDFLDQLLGEIPWRNSSDSETSSSSSSPSPLYLRHSSFDLEAYASRCPETSEHPETEVAEGKASTFLCPDSSNKHGSRKLGSSSSSCRENGCSSSKGWVNHFENLKSSVTFRRSVRGRSD